MSSANCLKIDCAGSMIFRATSTALEVLTRCGIWDSDCCRRPFAFSRRFSFLLFPRSSVIYWHSDFHHVTLKMLPQPFQIFRLLVIELPDRFCVRLAFPDHLFD